VVRLFKGDLRSKHDIRSERACDDKVSSPNHPVIKTEHTTDKLSPRQAAQPVGSVLVSNSSRPPWTFAQFPSALVEHEERTWRSRSLINRFKSGNIDALAALAVADVLNCRNHSLDELLLVKHSGHTFLRLCA
jgi:hypothetical protein